MTEFTAETLPNAIQKLFELNHYAVEGPIQIHGAEIDLVAKPISDPFGEPIFIEATIQYVDNNKYGKDVGKLALIAEVEPGAQKLIVSSKGFSLPVIERAKATRIQTLTYDELFKKFERFEPYVSSYLRDTPQATELSQLSDIYEEPNFSDSYGDDLATTFLTDWMKAESSSGQWLLITGEYGTGKTALTKILQYRWLREYQTNPDQPLPLRMELRDFASQFDARGLLHHFLDHNGLPHIPLEFVMNLIHSGRVILILDGYDEMAQYLHARERRACLEALAELSAGGARGILTSRPNYFTETENLRVFEILYKSLEHGKYKLGAQGIQLLEKEKRVDTLLEQFIDQYERKLKDLTPEQTKTLIERILSEDAKGREIVLKLLSRIFRSFKKDDQISLSGKPVIVSYLLDVVEGLKDAADDSSAESLTEWQVYKLIVDQLMLRDFGRSPDLIPDRRRNFLQRIAIFLSKRENPTISEDDFRNMISREFRSDITRQPRDSQTNYIEQLFADLRGSATLTRGGNATEYGWKFSHNSLREYLVAEALVSGIEQRKIITDTIIISDAMKTFASSLGKDRCEQLVMELSRTWRNANMLYGRGALLCLLWDGLVKLYEEAENPRETCLKAVTGEPPMLNNIALTQMEISSEVVPVSLENADFSDSHLFNLSFCGAKLKGTNFTNSTLEGINFDGADLEKVNFNGSFIMESDFSGSIVLETDFTGIDPENISISVDNDDFPGKQLLDGLHALGYLRFQGAITDDFPAIYEIQHHSAFKIVDKIIGQLAKQTLRQRRGIEQRGAARKDVNLAREFVKHMEHKGLISTPMNRKDLIEVTEQGRKVFSKYAEERVFGEELMSFFEENLPTSKAVKKKS